MTTDLDEKHDESNDVMMGSYHLLKANGTKTA